MYEEMIQRVKGKRKSQDRIRIMFRRHVEMISEKHAALSNRHGKKLAGTKTKSYEPRLDFDFKGTEENAAEKRLALEKATDFGDFCYSHNATEGNYEGEDKDKERRRLMQHADAVESWVLADLGKYSIKWRKKLKDVTLVEPLDNLNCVIPFHN